MSALNGDNPDDRAQDIDGIKKMRHMYLGDFDKGTLFAICEAHGGDLNRDAATAVQSTHGPLCPRCCAGCGDNACRYCSHIPDFARNALTSNKQANQA